MQNLFLITAFGVLGIISRFGIDKSFGSLNQSFPISTFSINIIGSFLAGLIYVLGERQEISTTLQTALLVGFCGGFTTFSAYSLQSLLLMEKGKFIPALVYFSLSPAVGLLAAFIPVLIVRKM